MPGVKCFGPVLLRWRVFVQMSAATLYYALGYAWMCQGPLGIGIVLWLYFHLDGYVIVVILEGWGSKWFLTI